MSIDNPNNLDQGRSKANENKKVFETMMPGELVRRQRKALGINQSQLAEQVGCSQGTISRIESGISPVLPELVGVLGEILDLAPSALRPDIFGEAGE